MLLTGIGGAFMLSKVLTTPMRNLRRRMESVRAGVLDIEIEQNGPDCHKYLWRAHRLPGIWKKPLLDRKRHKMLRLVTGQHAG